MNSDSQAPNPTVYQSQSASTDEISLVDIINVLWRRKKIVLGITLIAVVAGLFYAFTQKRVYQVETILLPPSFENIQPLNALNNYNIKSNNLNSNNLNSNNLNSNNLNSNNLNSNDAFAVFIGNINSRKLKKAFFEKFKVLETFSADSTQALTEKNNNKIFEGFLKAIKVKVGKETADSTVITLEGTYKEKIGFWLDSLVEMANQESINQLVRNLHADINSKIKSLKIEISSKRSIYKQRREDELRRLEEAYQIAKELGIRGHLFVPNVEGSFNRAVSAELNSISKSLSNENNLSVYMKGTKVLQAEINALKNRKSDDFHITGLRDLEEQLTRLESIKIEKDKLQAVRIDKKAVIDVEPIRPNRKLIAILSLILGGMLGIFAVFIVEFVNNLKKQTDKMDVV